MIGALFFLVWNSWVNSWKLRIRRLKQPKYLIGAIFGLLYIFYLFGIRIAAGFASSRHRGGAGAVTPENAQMFEAIGALILFGLVFLGWVFGRERASLVFSEAEVAFLFPAPVSRRALIHYKLIKSQVAILFMILFLTLIFGRFWSGGMAWTRSLGWWVILTTLNLHIIAASFAREKLFEHGISNWKWRTGVLTLVGAAAIGVFVWARQTIPPPDVEHMKQATDFEYYFENVTKAGPLPYLLYPFRIAVHPYIEGWVGTLGSFLLALGPALLLMAAHYWWVMRADVAFEEASVEASKRMAEKVATMRANRGQWTSKPTKKKRAPFKLKPAGPAAIGLLWKNLIGAGSMFTWRFWLFMAIMAVPFGSLIASTHAGGSTAAGLGTMVVMLVVMSFLLGPQFLRQDFRQDLAMADVLKTYPLRGWQVALGELLAPAVILTGFQWLLLILGVCVLSKWEIEEFPMGLRLAIASGVAMIAPGLNVVSLLIPNASVLLFPGWFQTGKEGPQGIEATGQRIVFMFGSMIAFGVSMILPTILFVSIYFLAQFVVGPVLPVPLAALGAALVLAAEAGFGIWWLGRMFDKFDIAAEN
jgi:ABC-2 type transport system permease protein